MNLQIGGIPTTTPSIGANRFQPGVSPAAGQPVIAQQRFAGDESSRGSKGLGLFKWLLIGGGIAAFCAIPLAIGAFAIAKTIGLLRSGTGFIGSWISKGREAISGVTSRFQS
jgi:hypothetical protein